MHELRHTLATEALMAGVPDDVVANVLGHSTVATLHNIYTHPHLQGQQAVVDVVDKLLDSKLKIKIVEK